MRINQNYYKELSKFDTLSQEEIEELYIKIQAGDTIAKNHLIQSNLKLVLYYAKQFYKEVKKDNIIEYDDLIAEGNIGLIKACEKFNPDANVKFSYYASFWIKKYIKNFILDNQITIRKPQNKYLSDIKINKVCEELFQKEQRQITHNDIEALQLFTPSEISNYFDKLSISSIENEINLENKIEDKIDGDFYLKQKEFIINKLNLLNQQQRLVIINIYGIDTEKKLYKEIGEMLNVSKQRIQQIHNEALDELSITLKNYNKI
jgi:RNA polymerase sigma factor (sigma-70 family)